jgi:adenylate cyclase
MWILTVRSPGGEPRQFTLHPGNNTLGRMSGNDIVILDPSASRYHAQVIYEPEVETITASDLDSTNGTFINRDRLTSPRLMKANDVIRIGQHLIELSNWEEGLAAQQQPRLPNTQQLTRDLVLESLDQHAVLLSEVTARLNTIFDLPTALQAVASMMKTAMGADRCEVILVDQIDRLAELGFARSIAQQAIQQRSAVILQDAAADQNLGRSASLLNIHAALCVPVMTGDEMLALIYVFKNRPRARPFEKRDLQLAIAIGHQAALSIQRIRLLERVRKHDLIINFLHRSLSSQEVEFVFKEYLETGELPPFQEQHLTVLIVDICDPTGLAEKIGPHRLGAILGAYYSEMTRVIFNHGGRLSRYQGNGLMAIFGLPHQPPEPELRAVQAGLEMLGQLEQINSQTGEQIQIGVGINTGSAIAGYLGENETAEFIVIGHPIHIAWGLEALARPNRIVIGDSTCRMVTDKFSLVPLGAVDIRHQAEPVLAFEVQRDQA